jgi:hypothetical protein
MGEGIHNVTIECVTRLNVRCFCYDMRFVDELGFGKSSFVQIGKCARSRIVRAEQPKSAITTIRPPSWMDRGTSISYNTETSFLHERFPPQSYPSQPSAHLPIEAARNSLLHQLLVFIAESQSDPFASFHELVCAFLDACFLKRSTVN